MGSGAERRKGELQVFEAGRVAASVQVQRFEHLLVARFQHEVVPAHGVLEDDGHLSAAVGIETVTRSQADLAGIVDRSARRPAASAFVVLEGEQNGNLLFERVGQAQDFFAPIRTLLFDFSKFMSGRRGVEQADPIGRRQVAGAFARLRRVARVGERLVDKALQCNVATADDSLHAGVSAVALH